MTSFNELWDGSEVFRNFFIGSNGYFSEGNLKWDIARDLWDNRFPKIEWCFCHEKGCPIIIPNFDGACFRHSMKMPMWRFARGELLKRRYNEKIGTQYRNYLKELAEKKYGDIPLGYRVIKIDGNPFNFHSDNICLLSKITLFLTKHGLLPVKMAIEFDNEIDSFMRRRFNDGYRSIRQSVITHDDIANSAGIDKTLVRKAISKGMLDFNNLDSIVDFIIKRRALDRGV